VTSEKYSERGKLLSLIYSEFKWLVESVWNSNQIGVGMAKKYLNVRYDISRIWSPFKRNDDFLQFSIHGNEHIIISLVYNIIFYLITEISFVSVW